MHETLLSGNTNSKIPDRRVFDMKKKIWIYLAAALWVIAAVQVWTNFRFRNNMPQEAFRSSEYQERTIGVNY